MISDKEAVIKRKRNDDELITVEDALKDSLDENKELYEEALDQYDQKWGEEDKCTFEKGYITQPVYACKNCPNTFGFCYGCSMHCHIDHEIYELFKKRSFRCDCGTSVAGDIKCILQDKVHQDNNDKNIYNHNFQGKYCYCDQSYDYKEDMVQCLFCFDWFHETCIALNSTTKETVSTIPEADQMQDFVCLPCLKKLPFLLDYPQIRLKDNNNSSNSTTNDINSSSSTSTLQCKRDLESIKIVNDLFCKFGWRDELCRCQQCQKLYEKENILFLFEPIELDSEDEDEDQDEIDIQGDGERLEKKRIKRPENPFLEQNLEKSIEQFQNKLTDHQQEKLVQGYQQMKDKIFSFLKSKTEQLQQQQQQQQQEQSENNNNSNNNGNIVITKQDIKSLFNGLSK
ncbi:ubiquitin protein ligase E3 component n-recognin 7 [Cavenderia fasciculata]|uniref:Ubiquitin protein ligase E3 component n-recognin 7 n=1 Tax=Cavenderia fasciculata TaxID=261658 RepID=F4Q6C1_CACFS|nr:ubiquitin protein ligase E3 component n-recognin 7 [Cavenderia fasciculata]EGG16431.1 ubiquitin protein ligase E3 component n-recognin 7 [Cavenderia fasciculata]|eukprot:XP_004354831.1 ubiquitin protein ligase E3 component n-recognin 7 [Cavenderia fasciculata]